VRSVKLEQEVEKNKILSEALQTLATEHHELEQSVVKGSSPHSALSEDEFHDAMSGELTSYRTLLGRGGDSVTGRHSRSLHSHSPVGHWNTAASEFLWYV
ncbi:Oxysterol-binding protein- protein 1, partial [Ataeniobius toweri]|nr:Oxysterol-binding protein- protein 1 [Ataeniobius toweri]